MSLKNMEGVLDYIQDELTLLEIVTMDQNVKDAIANLQETRNFDSKSPNFKTLIKEALNAGSVSVTFVKVGNGARRTMLCTTNPNAISKFSTQTASAAPAPKTDEYLRVFDLGINEWRSFRWETIVDYCIED